MTQEDKDLLLKDLCARLPYGVEADCVGEYVKIKYIDLHRSTAYISNLGKTKWESIEVIKPYLRPMSSMTEEEHIDFYYYHYNIGLEEIKKSGNYLKAAYLSDSAKFDWLNKHHFDYRYFIERDLAIAVTKENNPYED